jgi:uncharacterized protein YodC (DUF2158 family)
MKPKHGKFDCEDLTLVSGHRVVLASGGPAMTVECVEGDNAVCSWPDWEWVKVGTFHQQRAVTNRSMFAIATLRKLVPVSKEELEQMAAEGQA